MTVFYCTCILNELYFDKNLKIHETIRLLSLLGKSRGRNAMTYSALGMT